MSKFCVYSTTHSQEELLELVKQAGGTVESAFDFEAHVDVFARLSAEAADTLSQTTGVRVRPVAKVGLAPIVFRGKA
jgi:hypothetical protein